METDYHVDEAERKSKRERHAPCSYFEYNEVKHRDEECYPAVICNHDCGKCGWNPEVREKRIQALLERWAKEEHRL